MVLEIALSCLPLYANHELEHRFVRVSDERMGNFGRPTNSNLAGLSCLISASWRSAIETSLKFKGYTTVLSRVNASFLTAVRKVPFDCLFITRSFGASPGVKPVDIFCHFVSGTVKVETL